MQTAIEWLYDKWNNCKEWKWEEIEQWFEQAKEMEKQQIIDAYAQGRFDYEDFSKGIKQKVRQSKDYFTETYGSKGSDETENDPSEIEEYTSCPICNGTSINGFCSTPNCAYSLYEPNKDDLEMTPISSQTEISDEEIAEKAEEFEFTNGIYGFKQGVKWAIEQLKSRQ